jgi:hypothetical protein
VRRARGSLVDVAGAIRGHGPGAGVRPRPGPLPSPSPAPQRGAAAVAGDGRGLRRALRGPAPRAAAPAARAARWQPPGCADHRAGRRGQEHPDHPPGAQAGGRQLHPHPRVQLRGQPTERGPSAASLRRRVPPGRPAAPGAGRRPACRRAPGGRGRPGGPAAAGR